MKDKIVNRIGKSNELIPIIETLKYTSQLTCVLWIINCFNRISKLYEKNNPSDTRLSNAINVAITWVENKRSLIDLLDIDPRIAAFRTMQITKERKEPIDHHIIRACAYTIGSCYDKKNAIKASIQTLSAIFYKSGYSSVLDEIDWQYKLLLRLNKDENEKKKV